MPKTYHFIGIGGIGMSGLARLLLEQKLQVSGSDVAVNTITEQLISAGATIYQGHDAKHVPSNATVVYSTGIQFHNPEYKTALEYNYPLLHRSELLAQLAHLKRSIAVTGTHGKTTTTALLAAVLMEAGLDPSFAVGGVISQLNTNAHFGQGNYFVLEADESDRSFLNYFPHAAIVTNIDRDHLDHYAGDERLLVKNFEMFMTHVSGEIFWCGDDTYLRELNHPGHSYGFSPDCRWRITDFEQKGFVSFFDIKEENNTYQAVELPLIGHHNALNALAVFGLAIQLGVDEQIIRKAFKNFKGVLRRAQVIAEEQGVLFLDDYAHHPTEINATLNALKRAVGDKRLIAVFQPHRYSRTQDCLHLFGNAFEKADVLIITDIYGAGEEPIPGLSHEDIIKKIRAVSTVPIHAVERQDIATFLAQFVRPHDVVVTLGAGNITTVPSQTIKILQQQPLNPLRVGLIFGGSPTEHLISLRSSMHFLQSLNRSYYHVQEFGIQKNGGWLVGSQARFMLEQGHEQQMQIPFTAEVVEELMQCDVLIPVLHGPRGEDGAIQGFFELLGKAYVGCDHRSAAVSMDKLICKKIAWQEGLKTAACIDFSSYQWQQDQACLMTQIQTHLTLPVFVKPIHLGSSVGVKKVDRWEELVQAIHEAFKYDTHLIIENGIVGREVEFAVLGLHQITVFPPGEILNHGAVYDYQSKYSDQAASTTPCADLPQEVAAMGQQLAEKIFRAIGCQGLARVDFFLDQQGTYWFNEINPMPGFTATSLYPQMCAHHGLTSSLLMDQLVILALSRKRQQERLH